MANKKETKRARFVRVAEQRTNKILDDLHALSKCAHPAVYEYTEADVEKIFAAIEEAVREARDALNGSKRFSLTQSKDV